MICIRLVIRDLPINVDKGKYNNNAIVTLSYLLLLLGYIPLVLRFRCGLISALLRLSCSVKFNEYN